MITKNDKSTNRPSLSPSSLLHPKHSQYIRAWDVQNMYEGGRYACIERKIKNYNTYKKGKKMDRKLGDDTSSRIPSYTQEEKITITEKALTSSMTPKNKEVHNKMETCHRKNYNISL